LIVTAGLGQNKKADTVEIHWPSGEVDRLTNVDADQFVTVQEGKNIISVHPYGKPPMTAPKATVLRKAK
jgi:hypothetical protein